MSSSHSIEGNGSSNKTQAEIDKEALILKLKEEA